MKRRLPLLSALLLAACGGGGGDGSDGGMHHSDGAMVSGEPTQLAGITAAHNDVRHGASPTPSPPLPDLTWDNTVAAAAQAWSDKCKFEHTPNNPYGQNIYAAAGFAITGAGVTDDWASEAANYNYGPNTCDSGEVCGHYTQVVWRNSTKLGCGYTHCTGGGPFGGGAWDMVVCNYDPPGNFNGAKPY